MSARQLLAANLSYDPILDICLYLGGKLVDHRLSDVTAGATHYYAASLAPPSWTRSPAVLTVQIGQHRFYRHVA